MTEATSDEFYLQLASDINEEYSSYEIIGPQKDLVASIRVFGGKIILSLYQREDTLQIAATEFIYLLNRAYSALREEIAREKESHVYDR